MIDMIFLIPACSVPVLYFSLEQLNQEFFPERIRFLERSYYCFSHGPGREQGFCLAGGTGLPCPLLAD